MKSDNVKMNEFKDYMEKHRENVFINSFVFSLFIFIFGFVFFSIYINSNFDFNALERVSVLILILLTNIGFGLFAGLYYMSLAKRKLLNNYVYYKITGDIKWLESDEE